MAEKAQTVPMDARFGNIKVAADQRYHEGIKEIIEKLLEDLASLAKISLAAFPVLDSWGLQPLNLSKLL